MSALTAWIMSILGIVVIGAIIDLVLPSGRMNKYIKSIFSAVTVLIIILPLPNLLKNGCSTDNFLLNEEVTLQDNYLEYTAKIKKESLILGLKAALKEEGITLEEVQLEGDFSGSAPIISAVKINLSQVVIVGQSAHINKYELVRNAVSRVLAVQKEVIDLYE